MDFAADLARTSGDLILRHWEAGGLHVERKADATVVTRTDREVEAHLRQRIEERYPHHGIIGEEYGSDREDAEWVWVLDPIDGTVSYIHGIPLFGSLIGLLHQGQPVLGVIHQPILRQLCIGDGEVTHLNGQVVRVAEAPDLAEATLLVTDPCLVPRYQDAAAFERLTARCGTFRGWGDCYGYLMVACGRAHLMLDPVLNPWDLLPLIPVIRGAGGIITDWKGRDAVTATAAIAAPPRLHAAALAVLNPVVL